MTTDWPRYLLFADAQNTATDSPGWRFVLSAIDAANTIAAEDVDDDPLTGGRVERLALTAALRGLEALDQPSLVTLVCPSRYVLRGFERGIKQWREGGWKWECFGRRVPVRDADLWRRVDQTLKFHRVDCRSWRFGASDTAPAEPLAEPEITAETPAPPRRRFDLTPSRTPNDPAMLLVTTKRTRRGVIRFDTEHTSVPAPASRRAAARRSAAVAAS